MHAWVDVCVKHVHTFVNEHLRLHNAIVVSANLKKAGPEIIYNISGKAVSIVFNGIELGANCEILFFKRK